MTAALRPLLFATLLLLAACASTRGIGDASTATGGVGLELEQRDTESMRTALYRVWPDGTLEWGGGRDAMGGTTTWTGTMSAESIAAFRSAIAEDGWLDGRPKATGTPRHMVWRIRVESGQGTRSYDVRGEFPAASRLESILEAASRQRHQSHLNALPQAGERMR